MAKAWESWGWQFGLVKVLATGRAITLMGGFALALSGNHALAQIIPDSTLGAERSVVTPNVNVRTLPTQLIEGGALRGTNLFPSFQEFNVGNGQRVYFANPAGIENILSRVSGNNLSKIFGTLGVNGGANLFLTNQYQPNPALTGNIQVTNIRVSDRDGRFSGNGGDVIIDSRGDLMTPLWVMLSPLIGSHLTLRKRNAIAPILLLIPPVPHPINW